MHPKNQNTRKLLSRTTSSGETAFPWKLHMVLEESVYEGFDDVISWIGDNAFKVHDPIQFQQFIMQRYFNQTQYKSFQRQRKYMAQVQQRSDFLDESCLSATKYFPIVLCHDSQHLRFHKSKNRGQSDRILRTPSFHSRKSRCMPIHGSNQGQEEGNQEQLNRSRQHSKTRPECFPSTYSRTYNSQQLSNDERKYRAYSHSRC